MGAAKSVGLGVMGRNGTQMNADKRRSSMSFYLRLSAFICVLSLLLPATAAAEQPYALVIAGLGGEPEYDKQFRELGERLAAGLRKAGVEPGRIVWLPPEGSRREEVARAFQAAAARARPDDPLFVFLIGHGSFDGIEYKMNLAGPDATASEFRQWLDRVPSRRQVVVNATSASGASVGAWSRAGRAVIAATKSGEERNVTVFMRFFAEALTDPAADQDKNGAVSVLEAFRYATQRVARFYESAGRLATEHAQLDDNGDGKGVRDPSPANGEGLLAAQVALARAGPQSARPDTPAARELRARKQELENAIEALKYRKATMPSNQYLAELEKLLLELAKVQQALEKMEWDADKRR